MAPISIKLFDWYALERILKSSSRDESETPEELFAWLRSAQIFAENFRSAFQKNVARFDVGLRSQIGVLIYTTTKEIVVAYQEVVNSFPQEELAKAAEILTEVVIPVGKE